MNCTTCRYELSLCLDGRLATGRRALVMQHVDGCAECNTFWTELQAAQRLALLLPREKVSDGFREQLWERIRSGEGTPEAVFREPVPMLAKARYALTGAAAAAAVLLCATWLRKESPTPDEVPVASNNPPSTPSVDNRAVIGVDVRNGSGPDEFVRFEDSPLVSSAQRLTTNVFALETARQMEQRHASAHLALRRLGEDATDSDAAVGQVLTNANEFLTFGECLLELGDRKQLRFEPDIEADLRFAIKMLGSGNLQRRDLRTVRDVVAPALQSSLLGRMSNMISLVPLDPRQERDVLVRLNAQRPEVFPMLFFVFGSDDELHDTALLRRGRAFVLDDPCGPSWVAPRSEVEARDAWIRTMRTRTSGPAHAVDVQIQIQKSK